MKKIMNRPIVPGLLSVLLLAAISSALPHSALAFTPVWEPGETKCMPNFRNDAPVGYLCVKVEPGSLYDDVGLKKGDNVVEINGQPMNGPSDDAIDLWRTFERTGNATITVERDGQMLTLVKNMQERRSPMAPFRSATLPRCSPSASRRRDMAALLKRTDASLRNARSSRRIFSRVR